MTSEHLKVPKVVQVENRTLAEIPITEEQILMQAKDLEILSSNDQQERNSWKILSLVYSSPPDAQPNDSSASKDENFRKLCDAFLRNCRKFGSSKASLDRLEKNLDEIRQRGGVKSVGRRRAGLTKAKDIRRKRSSSTMSDRQKPDNTPYDDGSSECAVCLQPYVQPVKLPCRHVFCYLCVKGVTNQNKKCAMCRQDIPATFLDNPNVLSAPSPSVTFDGSYQWFYEGRNGWWQYDDRTSSEIETAYQNKEKSCEVLIAGLLYVIDFGGSVQYRRNEPFRKRGVKRDVATIAKKGVAGIRQAASCDTSDDEMSD